MDTDRTIVFNGKKYFRYLNSKREDTKNYWIRHERFSGALRRKYLHRDVWEYFNGQIPPGHVIHHLDGNPLNNDIKNLELITPSDHAKEHLKDKLIAMRLGKMSPQASINQRKGSKRSWDRAKKTERPCIECGSVFYGRRFARVCSTECKRLRSNRQCRESRSRFRKNRLSSV